MKNFVKVYGKGLQVNSQNRSIFNDGENKPFHKRSERAKMVNKSGIPDILRQSTA